MDLYLHSPNTPSWCGAQLKHRDDFTLPYLTLPLNVAMPVCKKQCPRYGSSMDEAQCGRLIL